MTKRLNHETAGPVQMVPVEASPKQELAANNHHTAPTWCEDHRISIYRAMLAASPADIQADVVALIEALRRVWVCVSPAVLNQQAGDDLWGEIDAALSRFKVEEDDA